MAQILCIEDNPDFLEVVSYELRNGGHEVIETNCGSEGFELIHKHKPALVISDIIMPRMSGLELLIKVRSSEKDISETPVILISAATHKHYHDEAVKFGVTDYMLKPINWDDFLYAVKRAIDTKAPTTT